MKKTRFLSAFLALLMLVGPLASCATGDLPDDTKAEQTAAATEEGTGITDDLPALDYNDQEVTIISRDMEGWTRGEVSVDGVKGDPVNDAVFERNKACRAASEHQDQQHTGQLHRI